ncbi:ATP-grasp domain-containing protein [Xanthomonas oryzae]|nr:ATP-grasp domain-containing protein [Xanthomonas oryzae]AKO19616.1 hypothetical protein ACU11_09245 [Xanthomonas oryzae pv. oryzicola]PUE97226.1 ATP-grasp domain-containing protein [Xanthomonas oryzae pv. oryzicola]WVN05161.1 ATP-grasp domain-containing protein [Xanthomonas oryzae pv. oryzicola]
MGARRKVVVVERVGYDYLRHRGAPILDPARFEVHLIAKGPIVDQARPNEVASTTTVSMNDPAEVAGKTLEVARSRGADAIVALSERDLLSAALARDKLNLPGPRYAMTHRFRDKLAMKRALGPWAGAPRFSEVTTETHALAMLDEMKGRLVVKPRDGMGTEGVRVISTPEEARAAFASIGSPEDYEIEEFVDGQLHYVDAVVSGGAVTAHNVSRYEDDTFALMRGVPLVGYSIDDEPLRRTAKRYVEAVVADLGMEDGVIHLEAFLQPDGSFRFCEIAARPGGSAVPAVFEAITGVNLRARMIGACLGEPDAFAWTDSAPIARLGAMILFPSKEGTVVRAPTADDFPESWIVRRNIRVAPGQSVSAAAFSTDCAASFAVVADTATELAGRISLVKERFRLETTDPERSAAC